jgi:hypothetical protein
VIQVTKSGLGVSILPAQKSKYMSEQSRKQAGHRDALSPIMRGVLLGSKGENLADTHEPDR